MNKLLMALPLLFAVSTCAQANDDTIMTTPTPSTDTTQPTTTLPDTQNPVTCPENNTLPSDTTPDVPSDGGAPPAQGL